MIGDYGAATPSCPPGYTWWPPGPAGRCEPKRTFVSRPSGGAAPGSAPGSAPWPHGRFRGIGQTPTAAAPQVSKPLPPIIGGVIIVGVVGLIGWLIYNSVQERKRILEKEGSSGLLKYEAGTAAIGVGSALAHRMIDGRARRNGRRRRRRAR
jgi:hypothetical protein